MILFYFINENTDETAEPLCITKSKFICKTLMSTWIYVIALMPPLSLIKRLKMYVQATFVFFCAKLYKYFFYLY